MINLPRGACKVSSSSGCFGRMRQVSAPVAAALLVTGCFHYVPLTDAMVPSSGTEVRATLSPPRNFNMGEFTLNEVTTVEGRLVDPTPDSLGLWVTWFRPRGGERYYGNYAGYYIGRDNVAQLEEWRLSPKRTIALGVFSAGVIAGFYALIRFALLGSDLGGGEGKGPIEQ